ncbi:MAG: peptide deformylase [Bacilli bacterium]|nr:peptide deformylase [Bacilli bacterium]
MIRTKDIIDEYDKRIRLISKEVTFPLDDKTKKVIKDSLEMLRLSQIEEYSEKYDLRPGMGLSLIQLGITKRIFVICYEVEEGKFEEYVVINPKIITESEEMIYVEEGEGCLSINRPIDGIVPRHARIKAEYYDENGNKITKRFREELAVVFQHELDHLNGILFYDRIDKKNPFKNADIYRPI